jgi:CAAX protease family protein
MDPAFPSMPPPAPDDGVKPMSLLGASMWALGAQIAFLWVLYFAASMREGAGYNLFGRIICQMVGFLLTLYAMLRVYAPEVRIRDFVAWRGTHLGFYPLGIVLGLSATFPTYWLLGIIEKRFPPPEQLFSWTDAFYQLTLPGQIAVAVGTIALGPLMEELIFRGALFRPLRQQYAAAPVVLVTAVLFAAVHLDPHRMFPLFLMGAVLGYVRWASGSLVPPLLLHMSFNAVPFVDLFRYDQPPTTSEELPLQLLVGAGAALVIALLSTHVLARRSRQASAARRDDT